ncbi:MAG: hypothetical protein PHT33_14945 [bacterium]|nr:hypothetical protein [bacterium]
MRQEIKSASKEDLNRRALLQEKFTALPRENRAHRSGCLLGLLRVAFFVALFVK